MNIVQIKFHLNAAHQSWLAGHISTRALRERLDELRAAADSACGHALVWNFDPFASY